MLGAFKFAIIALTLGAIPLGVVFSGPAMAAGDVAVIEKRIKFYRDDILKPFLAIRKFAKEDVGTAAEVEKNARLIAAASAKIPSLFPKGTSRGDFDAKTTRALPKIWEEWAVFEAAARTLGAEAATLATVAAKGDPFDIGDQFGVMGKKGCGGCHKLFRGDKVK